MNYTFVLKDKGTRNQGWWLKITNVEELTNYIEETTGVYDDVLREYMYDKHYSKVTQAVVMNAERKHLTILDGIRDFRTMVALQQLESIQEYGGIYVNSVGGYHHCHESDVEYGYIVRDVLVFPKDSDEPNVIELKNKESKEKKEFGWLSPTGDFMEATWGTHDEAAKEIITVNSWEDEHFAWHIKKTINKFGSYRDFLTEVKGYALVHDPSINSGYIVTHEKPLTKKQKEFLYGYFMDMGNVWQAEEYLN